MKKIVIIAMAVFCALSSMALYAQDEIQYIQNEWGKDRRELIRIGMGLSAADSAKFWPVYDQYEAERQKLGRERLLILTEYTDNYSNMTNAKADELITRILKNEAGLTQLQQQYYPRFKTALNAMQAARFLHIDSYLNTVIRERIQGALPVIGELDSLKTNKG